MLGEENYSPIQSDENSYSIDFSTVLQKVFSMMTIGLLVTGLTSLVLLNVESLLEFTFSTMWIWLIAEIILVLYLSLGIKKMGSATCTLTFYLYSIVNGITLTPFFLVYTESSIATVFFITAGVFAATSIYGKTTKRDLTKLGSFLFMALIGLIIASLVNLFLGNTMLDFIISIAGIIIFIGLTAYDVQKIKEISSTVGLSSNDDVKKVVTMGALTLYLDFINIFIKLLSLLGKRRD